jgi:septum formation protein
VPVPIVARILLASASPRRRALLELVGFEVEVSPVDLDESLQLGEPGDAAAERLARAKAHASLEAGWCGEHVVAGVAADTVVWRDGEVLGKPTDKADARRMLRSLSGAEHRVTTGWAVWSPTCRFETRIGRATTRVSFRPILDADIDAYVETGEPMDKAGAYGIQGRAAVFIDHIVGDWSNVVGLPIGDVVSALRATGAVSAIPFGGA